MHKSVMTAASVLVAAIVLAPPAEAITNGYPDGGDHPNVGALLVLEPEAAGYTIGATGTLISDTVFLTAGHATWMMSYYFPPGTTYAVSFESDLEIDPAGYVHPDTLTQVTGWEFMPSYGANGTRDVGVAYLESSPAGLVPAELPPLGAAATAVDGMVVNVGYGWNSLDRSVYSPNATYTSSGRRTSGISWVGSISPNWLTAHSAPASTCYHDSGGPQFADGVLVSITTTGDMPCVTLQRNQRLDLPDVQEWLTEKMG